MEAEQETGRGMKKLTIGLAVVSVLLALGLALSLTSKARQATAVTTTTKPAVTTTTKPAVTTTTAAPVDPMTACEAAMTLTEDVGVLVDGGYESSHTLASLAADAESYGPPLSTDVPQYMAEVTEWEQGRITVDNQLFTALNIKVTSDWENCV